MTDMLDLTSMKVKIVVHLSEMTKFLKNLLKAPFIHRNLLLNSLFIIIGLKWFVFDTNRPNSKKMMTMFHS